VEDCSFSNKFRTYSSELGFNRIIRIQDVSGSGRNCLTVTQKQNGTGGKKRNVVEYAAPNFIDLPRAQEAEPLPEAVYPPSPCHFPQTISNELGG
jgi:hypothetical protein